jgi:ParB family chromosome partitioning protein
MQKEIIDLDINLIDEDPNQPRKTFDNITELSESIKERGVKSPISVHPIENGRYMINHGARRYRASKLAGKTTIPAFIDDDYNLIDQVVENIQRDELTVREIVDVIAMLYNKKRMKKKDIAEKFHKSSAWVSERYALSDAPEPVLNLINTNKVTDVSVLAQLGRLYSKEPSIVENFIKDTDDIKRTDIADLTAFIESKSEQLSSDSDISEQEKIVSVKEPQKQKPVRFKVMHNGRLYELRQRKATTGNFWIRDIETLLDKEVPGNEIQLIETYQED